MSYFAEQNVVGSLLMDGEAIDRIAAFLEPEMFTSELLGRVYLEYLRGYENGYPVNLVTVRERLCGDKMPESVVAESLKECVSVTVTSAQIKSYAEAVRDDYKAAQVGKLLSGTRVTAAGVNEQIGQLLTELEALRDDKAAKAKTLAQIAAEYQNNYFCEHPDGLKVGLPNLDDMIGGLEGGDIIVIGARPAVGKSALVTQITTNLAEQGKKIGFYNLEMSDKQMYERFVASQSGLGLTRIRRAVKFLGDEEKRFKMANNALAERSNIVISTGAKTVSEIRSESRHMGFDVIVIDYLQLIRSDTFYRGNRVAEVGAISKAIKALAMELNIPIILLSQLNRASEGRETREPSMSELRESGDIEQDASVIILLWNMSEEDRSKKGCKVEKNRQGETGKMELRFDGDKMRFKDAGEWQESVEDCPFT
jgi:replicative DNA helicase